jgi:glycosyltransferase involved in cell wall biosynthesis
MQNPSPKALFVHQGFEMYGSDRSFIQSVEAFKKTYPNGFVTAIVPRNGPIVEPLKEFADEVIVEKMLIPRGAEAIQFFLRLPWRLPTTLWRSSRRIKAHDFLYINTNKVLDYTLSCRLTNKPAILHLREIIEGRMGQIFDKICALSKAIIVFNSQATADSFSQPVQGTPIVIHNGTPAPISYEENIHKDKLNLLFLGRFNDWKGPEIIVEAINKLSIEQQQKVAVRLVGDVFEKQVHFKENILQSMTDYGLNDIVTVESFTPDIAPLLNWSNLLIVPSTKPEPFGRVATEAMSFGRAVLASNHGGLVEIIENGKSGFLFEPSNAQELAELISDFITQKYNATQMGEAARKRYEQHFSAESYIKNMGELYQESLSQ